MQAEIATIREQLVIYACKYTKNRYDAEDFVHDVLEEIWKKRWFNIENHTKTGVLKRFIKFRFINDKKRHRKFTRGTVFLENYRNFWPEDKAFNEEELYEEVGQFIEKHKHGYIILEMEKRKVKSIKSLAPFLNEKKETLYKKYQKLKRGLKEHLKKKGGGVIDIKPLSLLSLKHFFSKLGEKVCYLSK